MTRTVSDSKGKSLLKKSDEPKKTDVHVKFEGEESKVEGKSKVE